MKTAAIVRIGPGKRDIEPIENFKFVKHTELIARLRILQKPYLIEEKDDEDEVGTIGDGNVMIGKAWIPTLECYSCCNYSHKAFIGIKLREDA